MLLDETDWRLMNDWQRGLPLVPCPFQVMADALKIGHDEVMGRLRALLASGAISRVGATCRPNTLAASTLAAVSAPEGRIDEVARIITATRGVNHCYERGTVWNLWFVATGPNRAFVDEALAEIGRKAGLRVLDLRLVQPFNVDLGFALDGTGGTPAPMPYDDTIELEEGDRALMQVLSEGMDLTDHPFEAIGRKLGRSEHDVLSRLRALSQSGVLSRLGLIVRHRPLGWRSNAMCVFDVPPAEITERGRALTRVQGVTLCYERRPVPGVWPYTLYCMIHARSRAEALDVLSLARVRAGLAGYDYSVLFSTRCFKQTGALIDTKGGA